MESYICNSDSTIEWEAEHDEDEHDEMREFYRLSAQGHIILFSGKETRNWQCYLRRNH